MPDLSPQAQDAVRRVEKLLKLAAKNPNEHEAAAAAAKAQEILAQYNLDMTIVEQNSGDKGKREDAKVKGGLYQYQRDLWQAVAELNFCMYWNMYVYDKTKTRRRKNRYDGSSELVQGGYTFQHRLVGRTVNTTMTRTMAEYLQQTIERLTRDKVNNDPKEFFTRWAMSYREGLADSIVYKIYERRKHVLAEELRRSKEAEKQAADLATKGESTATALTLADVRKSEEQANYDFLHGEGAWAKRKAQQAKWEADYAKREREEEAQRAKDEAAYTAWAAANPDEARQQEEERKKEEEAERKRDERNARRRTGNYRGYTQSAKEARRDSGAFAAGREAGRKVSIDPQTGTEIRGKLS